MAACRWGVVVGVAWLLAGPGLAADDGPVKEAKAAFNALKDQVEQLRAQQQPQQAIAACEQFLARWPSILPFARNATVLINNVVSADLKDPAERQQVYRRAYHEFGDCPEYYCLGVAAVARESLAPGGDPAKAEELLRGVIGQLGDHLPPDTYLGYNLYILHMQALRALGRPADALGLARTAALRSPWMIGDKAFLRILCDAARDLKEPAQTLAAAKLYFLLGDFTEPVVTDATQLVAEALTSQDGPGVALQFAKAQQDRALPNPLRDAPTFDLGPTATLLAAAGEDPEALLNVHLYQGRDDLALRQARKLLTAASRQNSYYVARALRQIARCFKAHDLSLQRANEYLTFHATGTGANPLKALEAELAKPAAPAASAP